MAISNYILLFIKILLPPIICFLCNYLGDGYNHFEIIIVPFSLLIVLPNLNKRKKGIVKTLILSLIFSFLTFFASILIPLGIGYPIEFLFTLNKVEPNLSEFIFKLIGIISYCIISPFIIFFWYKKLFIIPISKYTKGMSYLTLSLLTITLFIIEISGSLAIAVWQFIMVLALQLILYKKQIWN
jgi:hypothetical protein